MIDVRFPTALQMVLSLAVAAESAVLCSSTELAAGLGANPALVRKLMVPLSRAGIIRSTVGKHGGVRLDRVPEAITLRDIYQAVVTEKALFPARQNVPKRCVVSRNIEPFVAELAGEAENRLTDLLANKTIAQSLNEIRARDL